jgi:hypothetical protein
MKKFKTIDDMGFNVQVAKERGYDYFEANVLDMIARGVIGYKENGKAVVPTKAQIKAKYEQLTGFKVTKNVE